MVFSVFHGFLKFPCFPQENPLVSSIGFPEKSQHGLDAFCQSSINSCSLPELDDSQKAMELKDG